MMCSSAKRQRSPSPVGSRGEHPVPPRPSPRGEAKDFSLYPNPASDGCASCGRCPRHAECGGCIDCDDCACGKESDPSEGGDRFRRMQRRRCKEEGGTDGRRLYEEGYEDGIEFLRCPWMEAFRRWMDDLKALFVADGITIMNLMDNWTGRDTRIAGFIGARGGAQGVHYTLDVPLTDVYSPVLLCGGTSSAPGPLNGDASDRNRYVVGMCSGRVAVSEPVGPEDRQEMRVSVASDNLSRILEQLPSLVPDAVLYGRVARLLTHVNKWFLPEYQPATPYHSLVARNSCEE